MVVRSGAGCVGLPDAVWFIAAGQVTLSSDTPDAPTDHPSSGSSSLFAPRLRRAGLSSSSLNALNELPPPGPTWRSGFRRTGSSVEEPAEEEPHASRPTDAHVMLHHVMLQVSLLGDANSSLGDANSSLGDAESSLGDVRARWVTLRARWVTYELAG